MRGVAEMTPEEEEFNLRYRQGGGFPKEREHHRDSVTEMQQASHNPRMVWNQMAAMGCPVLSNEYVDTGCGGL